ncbi:MFS transporter [Paraconexibacter algicola]|uniref:MFS transporter n=1 Tax=Paraconexibacter algicola TaxID=2133960 RepID=A0A2T4UKA6_9ACTN|nr:MFS transporter [Paraconexibacter algicola]PTL59673.1 MFS transporter [Paraconexibacter algicola]
MSARIRRTFDPLHVADYRRYFIAQLISTSGNWIQNVAAVWLMVSLTGDGLAVGLVPALQFVPLLLLGQVGGLLADRVDKRRLLLCTQLVMIIPAAALAVIAFLDAATPALIYAAVLLRGIAMALDGPARQALPIELVGPDRVVGAVALNSLAINASRIIGPAVAGLLIGVAGIAWCFVVDALTFVAMIVAVARLDPARMGAPARGPREPHAIRAGVAYVRRTPELLIPLGMMALVGLLAFNFQVLLALLASTTWGGDAWLFTAMTMAMAVGSIAGAVAIGGARDLGPAALVTSAAAFGVTDLLVAASPTVAVQLVALVLLGAASVTFSSGVTSVLQLRVDPQMRGRVMALYSLVFLGSTPFGAPLLGWIGEHAGPRAGLALGGLAALAAAVGAAVAYRRTGGGPPVPPVVRPRAAREREPVAA